METKNTAAQVEAMTQDESCIKAVSALFQAIAFKEVLNAIIEAKQIEIINFYKFKVSDVWSGRAKPDFEIITEPRHMYLSSDEDMQIYCMELQSFYDSDLCPVKPQKAGNCPLLEAESMERVIFANVVDILASHTGLTYDMISRSLKAHKEYKQLVLSLFAPFVKQTI
jgi:hypothetical protein